MALNEKQRQQTLERQRRFKERQEEARRAELAQKGLPARPVVTTLPGTARWRGLIETARVALDTARTEMQVYWDDRSEAWQESDRASDLQARIEWLEGVLGDLDAEPGE